jgi:hypothetical protein
MKNYLAIILTLTVAAFAVNAQNNVSTNTSTAPATGNPWCQMAPGQQFRGCYGGGMGYGRGYGRGLRDGTGPRAQLGLCPWAGNTAASKAMGPGKRGFGKGQGRAAGRGWGTGRGLRDGTGPRSVNGACPIAVPANQ